jgi:hypothetical protein
VTAENGALRDSGTGILPVSCYVWRESFQKLTGKMPVPLLSPSQASVNCIIPSRVGTCLRQRNVLIYCLRLMSQTI